MAGVGVGASVEVGIAVGAGVEVKEGDLVGAGMDEATGVAGSEGDAKLVLAADGSGAFVAAVATVDGEAS